MCSLFCTSAALASQGRHRPGWQHMDGGAGASRHLNYRLASRAGPGRHRRHDGSAALVREVGYPACTPSGARRVKSRGALHSSRMKVHTGCKLMRARSTGWSVHASTVTSCAVTCTGSATPPVTLHRRTEQYEAFVPPTHTTSRICTLFSKLTKPITTLYFFVTVTAIPAE